MRVRPVSSYSQAGKDQQSEIGLRGGASSGAGGTHEDEDDKKFNSETLYDLNDQRIKQKEQKKKEEQEKALEAEKAEKKKKTKA